MAPQNEQTKAGTASRQCQKPPDVFTTVLASVPDVSIIPGGSHGNSVGSSRCFYVGGVDMLLL